jgi:hypothetical protein
VSDPHPVLIHRLSTVWITNSRLPSPTGGRWGYSGHKSYAKAQNLYLAVRRRGFKEEAPRARTGYWGCQGLGAKDHTISVHGLTSRFRCVSQISRGGGHRSATNHYGFCRQGDESGDEGCTKESQKDATRVDENGYPAWSSTE